MAARLTSNTVAHPPTAVAVGTLYPRKRGEGVNRIISPASRQYARKPALQPFRVAP
jgi:hypothetical protein